jgi:hypothetical protein
MSMREDWQKAKADCEKQFTEAYKAWTLDLVSRAEGGDPKAKQEWVKLQLAASGMAAGSTFTKYCNFSEGFGPALDAMETLVKKIDDKKKEIAALDLKKIEKDSKLAKAFGEHCKKTLCEENWLYYSQGYKLAPKKVHDDYILGKYDLNIDASLKEKWKAAAKDNFKKDGKKLLEETRTAIKSMIEMDTVRKFKLVDVCKEAAGLSALTSQSDTLKRKVLDIATDYFRQLQQYQTRWAKMKPEFWKAPMTVLDRIVGTVNA